MSTHRIRIKRVYDKPSPDDGLRVLVDGLWPRGLTKAKAKVDLWLRDIAPSAELRRWFGHDPAKWTQFKKRYAAELRDKRELLKQLRALAKEGPITLVYGARDSEHSNAAALRSFLNRRGSG